MKGMRSASSHLYLGALLLAALCNPAQAVESVVRSDPQTEGERRLLEWDTTRKFSPSKTTFSPKTLTGSKTVPIPNYSTRSFLTKNTQALPTFYTPEFLSPKTGLAQKSFATGVANVASASSFAKSFNSGKSASEPSTFAGGSKSSSAVKSAPDGTRPYLGPEADKMKQKYTPENGPKGGVSIGHQLSVEEVRSILNRNK
jgi:hypothetical protein